MATKKDRPTKRRIEILLGRYTANPMMRAMFKLGVTPPGFALIETIGRRSGAVRHTPIACYPADGSLWLIAQHGAHAGWVRNFQERPAVRVRLGRRWVEGRAHLLPDDDVKARIATFSATKAGRFVNAAMFRALESQPVTVRIDLA
jgi:deazaflavin-dependent oxidoreductase (nitroreductase family)